MAGRGSSWQNRVMMTNDDRLRRLAFCGVTLALWLALGWPVFEKFGTGGLIRGAPVLGWWFVPYAVLGAVAAAVVAMGEHVRPRFFWPLIVVQLAAIVAMTIIVPWAMMCMFLVIVAWQVALEVPIGRAMGWVTVQTGAVVLALAQALNPDLCWVIAKALALQLLMVFTAQALRRESHAGRQLARSIVELREAQALVAESARDAERLRISRELHDAWGHELTALKLQLEIASHVDGPRVTDHVLQAKALAASLLGKVRNVVAALREEERGDLRMALEALARNVPAPAVHIGIAPGIIAVPEQTHALVRCAQEAITNAVKHSNAANLWLDVSVDGGGIRLVARDDGASLPSDAPPGSGLLGMRERIEQLGGRLAVRAGLGHGFTIDAWLPRRPSVSTTT
jgi:signal transduction histidine kinase